MFDTQHCKLRGIICRPRAFYNPRKSYEIAFRTPVAHQQKGLYMTPSRRAEGGGGYGRGAKRLSDCGWWHGLNTNLQKAHFSRRSEVQHGRRRGGTKGKGTRVGKGFRGASGAEAERRAVLRLKGGTKLIYSGPDAWQWGMQQRELIPLRGKEKTIISFTIAKNKMPP